MSPAGGKRALVTAALLVAGIRLWMQLRGKTKTPFPEWAIGWGATFFILALMSEASPEAAGTLALTVVVGDFLMNGTTLLTDVTGSITTAEKGTPTFVPTPFAAAPATTPTSRAA